MRSVVVVLPASTWAMMPMLRSLSSILISNRRIRPAYATTVLTRRRDNAPRGTHASWVAGGRTALPSIVWTVQGVAGRGHLCGMDRNPPAERRGGLRDERPTPYQRYGHFR